VAYVSQLRSTTDAERRGTGRPPSPAATPRRNRPGRYIAGGFVAFAFALVVFGAVLLLTDKGSLTADSTALARVGLPLGGGKIEKVTVTTGPHSRVVPAQLRGDAIWPSQLIRANQSVSVDVVVKRPGWISWLAGGTEHLHLQLTTPSVELRGHYLTLKTGAPLRLAFSDPVRVIAFGSPGHMQRHVLSNSRRVVTLPRSSDAGSLAVAAAPRTWEIGAASTVSWFPAGAAASAVASPAPGSQIGARTPITLTFNKTVQQALGSNRPPVSPNTPGVWHSVNSHSIVFRPEGYGYGLGANVKIGLPRGVNLVGGATWNVPGGSPMRLQQLLSLLGYLPLKFHYNGGGVGLSPTDQLKAAIHPPSGHFVWRYPNVPSALHSMWQPGSNGTMTRGALMAFENDHGLTPDGVAGPTVWQSLIKAAIAGHPSTFGYSFVTVSLSGQSLNLWHNGKTVTTTPVNTGISSRPTAAGTFPVYSHTRVGTMSGTNPDGSHYDDPGIQFISYFNGGDALHAFTRAQYGFPQSLGCVEMQLGPAGQVWPYTPIGTLVNVA
jgi:peptidoglycan hydrolase-like protein with peptidoglycan-binding domain